MSDDLGQVARDRPHRRADRHVVVVENDDEIAAAIARPIQTLEGQPAREPSIADDRNNVMGFMPRITRCREPEGRRDRSARMSGAEGVVRALGTAAEAGDAAGLAQCREGRAPARQELVRIALVADIPDDLVTRRIEDAVQSHGKLDHPEARGEMAAGAPDRRYDLVADLLAERDELALGKAVEISRTVYAG